MNDEQVLGRYRLIELLGRGGFASVYRAENTSLGMEVALKIMDQTLARDERFVTRFRQEARETARLDHPNIVRILDLNQIDEQLFIAMEYVPGRDLSQMMVQNEQLLPLEQIVTIVDQVGSALDYAHRHQLVHRDIKPHNILVRPDGVIKLVDFGIVKAAEGTRLTRTGTLIGTPAYMSPEQIRGQQVEASSDIYSLGIVAYEMITGRVPFDGDTASLGYKHVHEPPPLPSSISSRAGGPIETVLLRALEKEPAARYETAGAFAAALHEAIRTWQDEAINTRYEQAQQYLQAKQYASARSELESLQAIAPGYREVEELLAQADAGLQLEQLYQDASNHLQAAREIVVQIRSKDPEFPDRQLVFQVLQGSPNPQDLATIIDGSQPSSSTPSGSEKSTSHQHKPLPLVTALRWAGLVMALLSYNGFWWVDNIYAWGITTWTIESFYPYIIFPPLFAAGYIILLVFQRFIPGYSWLWRLLRWGVAWLGAVLMLVSVFTIFDNRSTGPVVAVVGLFLAGLSDMLALFLKRNQA